MEGEVSWMLTRQLRRACRRQPQKIRFVFSSSLAVCSGGTLPECVTDTTRSRRARLMARKKAACELLVSDYTRKGYVRWAAALRLPTSVFAR